MLYLRIPDNAGISKGKEMIAWLRGASKDKVWLECLSCPGAGLFIISDQRTGTR